MYRRAGLQLGLKKMVVLVMYAHMRRTGNEIKMIKDYVGTKKIPQKGI